MNYEKFQPNYQGTQKNIFLVNMTRELNPYFSELCQSALKKYIKQRKNIVILSNKKWYSTGVLCQKCGHIPKCKNCSVSISYHKLPSDDWMGLCHICKTQYPMPKSCPECHSDQIKEFGLGIQKVAEYIQEHFDANTAIIDAERTRSRNKIQEIQQNSTWTQVFLGTSLLATPPAGLQVDLVIFLQADFGLNIPDYTANENNFHFLYDSFVNYPDATFVVQTFNPDHYSIRAACKLDKEWFWSEERKFRETHRYPPEGDLCVLLYKHEIEASLFTKVDALHKELLYLQQKYQLADDVEIYATPPLIYKMYGKFRYNIIIKGPQVRNFMDIIYSKLNLQKRGFKVDWQANSIV